ncbi:hypothetical protein PMAYCL1PPCAC_09209, partial [Pristionchus mayeri]
SFPEMLLHLVFFSLLSLVVSKECQKRLPSVCTTCCAILYDNDDCETKNLFRVKWDADGFLGAIWENETRVVEVYPGCLLTLWEMRNQTGQSRVLGLDGVSVHYLDRYAFSRRASSLACKCTTAAGRPPTTTLKPEEKEAVKVPARAGESVDLPVHQEEGPGTVPEGAVPKGGGRGETDSGYGSEPEDHLEEVKSLEDMGTGEEEKEDEKKEGEEKKDSLEDSNEEESEQAGPSTTVPSEQSGGADDGSDSPTPSEFSVPSLSHPIVDITLTPPIREVPLTIERILMVPK